MLLVNKYSKLPVYHFTGDRNIEVGLSWDPNVLLTGKEISFFVTFFDRANNKPNLLPFDFVFQTQVLQILESNISEEQNPLLHSLTPRYMIIQVFPQLLQIN
jgi:hypothetical protein